MGKPVAVIPDLQPSQELQDMRSELGILHEIFATLSGGQIRASEWHRAQTVLDYVNEKIEVLQARADHQTELEKAAINAVNGDSVFDRASHIDGPKSA